MPDPNRTEIASGFAGDTSYVNPFGGSLTSKRSPQDALDEARQLSFRDRVGAFLNADKEPSQPLPMFTPSEPQLIPSLVGQGLRVTGLDKRISDSVTGIQSLFAPLIPLYAKSQGINYTNDGTGISPLQAVMNYTAPQTRYAVDAGTMLMNDPQDSTPSAFDFGRKIAADGYLGGSGAVKRQQSGTTILKGALQRAQQAAYAPYAQQIGDLQKQYGERINALQDELAGYRGGLANVNKAYGSYADDANAILAEAASVEADALGESTVPAAVQASYDDFDISMNETLSRIDSSGNADLAKAMSEEVRYNEGVIVDGLRSGLASQDELHQLASSQAQALANMAWKDDLYNAELNRYKLELEIQQGIDAKAAEIQDTRTAMATAISDTQAAYEQIRLAPAEVWDLAMGDLLTSRGFNAIQSNDVIEKFNGIMQNPDAAGNYEAYKGQVTAYQNMEVIAQLGLTSDLAAILDVNPEARAALSVGPLTVESLAILGIDAARLPGSLEDMYAGLQNETDTLLDLWGQQRDFNASPEKYMQVDPSQVMGGEVIYSAEGDYAFPVMGFNWGSGGGFGFVRGAGRNDHAGVDIGAYAGTPVVSPVQGVVIHSGEQGIGGWTVTIKAPDGKTHYLAHMGAPSELRPGDTVNVGDYVGQVGSTGNASSGNPMLHYGIRDANGNPLDPGPALRSLGAWNIADPPGDSGSGAPRSNPLAPRPITPGRI